MSKNIKINGAVTRVMVYGFAVAALMGCALGRDVVAVKAPSADNPATGKAVRIEAVLREIDASFGAEDLPEHLVGVRGALLARMASGEAQPVQV